MRALTVVVIALLVTVIALQLRIVDVATKTQDHAVQTLRMVNRAAASAELADRRIAANFRSRCEMVPPDTTPPLECDRERNIGSPPALGLERSFWSRLTTDEPVEDVVDNTYDASISEPTAH